MKSMKDMKRRGGEGGLLVRATENSRREQEGSFALRLPCEDVGHFLTRSAKTRLRIVKSKCGPRSTSVMACCTNSARYLVG